MLRAVFFLALTSVICPPHVVGQDLESLKKRCEAIVVESIVRPNLELPGGRLIAAGLVLIPQIQNVLSKNLESPNAELRCFVANLLARESQDEFRDAIVKSMSELDLTVPADHVRRAAVLMQLGNESAKLEIEHWAGHEFEKLGRVSWICPMKCAGPSANAGRCRVCQMELVTLKNGPDDNDWDARLLAIQILQDSGADVSGQAIAIVVSDAPPFFRLQAAGVWARKNPADALPHIRIFMQSDLKWFATELLSLYAPGELGDYFQDVAGPGQDITWNNLTAVTALIRGGELAFLEVVRERVGQPETTDESIIDKSTAIRLLAEFGRDEDWVRLEQLLDAEYRFVAAETVLRILDRRSKLRN